MAPLFIGSSAFGLLIMGLLLALGIVMAKRERQFGQQACSAQGVIVALHERLSRQRTRRGRVRYTPIFHPVVQFQREDGCFAGERVTCELSRGSFPPFYAVGTHLPLLYDPSNPTHVQINTFRWRWLGICLWCFVPSIGMAFFTLMFLSTANIALHP